MASSQLLLITTAIFIILASPISSATASAQTHNHPFKAVYSFGDSYTDTGNTYSATGPSSFSYVSNLPYGRTFFHRPTNRYSDGRLVIDFVAEFLSLPFLPPYLNQKADKSYGVNFAVAGATAIRHSFYVRNNMTLNVTPQSLETELLWFDKFLESKGCKNEKATPKECDAAFDEALVWVGEIGANDYAYSFPSSVPSSTVQRLALKSVSGFLQAVLDKGAKYMVVQGLPPTGCLTLSMVLASEDDRDEMGCVASANKQSYTHNAILQAKLEDLRKQFPEAVIVYADFWNAYTRVVKNLNNYGFKEAFRVCCGSGNSKYRFDLFAACGSPSSTSCSDPSEFINWDGVHLTEAMYNVVAKSFLDGPFSQPSFSYLLSRKKRSG